MRDQEPNLGPENTMLTHTEQEKSDKTLRKFTDKFTSEREVG